MASRGNYKTVDYYQDRTNGVIDGFEAFSDQGMYYFTCNKNGEVFIISEGYTSSSARNRGIQSVAKNLMLATQYHFENLSSTQYCFTLKAGNNQEIAKSKIFETEDAMHAFIGWIIGKRFSANLIQDDFDENQQISKNKADAVLTGIYSNQVDYFIFKGTNGKQYFSFKNQVGKTLLLNTNVRGYENVETVNKILTEVLKFAPNINNYDFKLTKNGKYYFYLKNTNLSNIAKSTFFATEDEMMEVIDVLTLVDVEVSISKKGKEIDAKKSVDVQSDLFSEIDTKAKNEKPGIEDRLSNMQPLKSEKEAKQKQVEVSEQAVNEKNTSAEDEFTALLKQQQQAELEVRLKREKEEKDRKDEQNQYAKANAAVLRKHKEEQSIELDDKLKKEDIVKANGLNEASNKKPIVKTKETQAKISIPEKEGNVKEQLPAKKVKVEAPKAKIVEKKKATEIKNVEVAPKPVTNIEKPKLPTKKKESIPKKKEQQKESTDKAAFEKPVENNSTPSRSSSKKNERKYDKSDASEIDYELEKKKIANQERFEELKKAAEVRKRKEKEKQADKEVVEPETPAEKKSYDWWTKKDESKKDEFVLDEHSEVEIDTDKEPLNLINMLKPALIGLMVLALVFVGFRSFKSSSSEGNTVDTTSSNNNSDSGAALVNTASAGTNAEKNYYNANLPANFANFDKGSIEWHIVNCIVDDNCAEQQNFQWLETNFQLNASYVSVEALQSLDNIAKVMKEYGNTRLEIYGHIAGNEKDNFKAGKSLSEVRAKQVRDLLVDRNISADRLSYKGLAKTRPIQAGNSLTAHHQNKRVELVLFKEEQSL